MKHIYSIFLSAVSLLWMLSGCVEDPDMDTRLQKAKAPEVSETSMEGEAYASSITLKAQRERFASKRMWGLLEYPNRNGAA